jgi:acetyl-CoA carboxylase, biotin carboxylase subunit
MIHSLLIANRGEIAVRVIRTCREMGIETVAAYSQADAQSLHVKMADRTVCIGPPSSRESYLNSGQIITAALLLRCDAIHPGVGFLAENPQFAKDVQDAELIFIGPDPGVMQKLGDKIEAKRIAAEAGIPLIPGSDGPVASPDEARAVAEGVGYPILLKAAAGGGGKGIRVVQGTEELAGIFDVASNEARAAFADGTLYVEKLVENPRHVEVQLLADGVGNVLFLGERDCSVQQNHQKLVEESPSPAVAQEMRDGMGRDGVRLFKTLGYKGAGTIEFLVKDGKYYFMEVNARVQVEHPVSEMVTGVDIIREQILACCENALSLGQSDIRFTGYAMECRINARTAGKVLEWRPPGGFGVRTDSFLYGGCTVPPYYDHLVAKVIVHGRDRREGIARMRRALGETVLSGIDTNIALQRKILETKLFQSGSYGVDILSRLEKENAL